MTSIKNNLIFILLAILSLNKVSGQNASPGYLELEKSWQQLSGEDPGYIKTAHELGLAYAAEGYFSLAKSTFLAGLDQYHEGDSINTREYVYLMADLGSLYWDKGEMTIARDLYADAEKVLSGFPGIIRDDRYLDLKTNLSIADARLGNNLSAMVGFTQVRTLFEKEFEGRTFSIVNTIIRIADVYLEIENLQQAANLYLEAEDQLNQIPGSKEKDLILYVLTKKKALYFLKNREIEKAINTQKNARDLALQLHGEGVDYAQTLAFLGSLYLENGQLDLAKSALIQALTIQEEMSGTYHMDYLNTLALLADLNRVTSHFEEASVAYNQVLKELIRQFKWLSPVMSIQEKANYYKKITNLMDKVASLMERVETPAKDIYSDILNYKFVINDLQLHPPPVDRNNVSANFTNWKNLNERLLYLYQLPVSQLPEGENTFAPLLKETRDLEKKIIKDDQLEIRRGDGDNATWRDLKKLLADDEVAIEILRYHWYGPENLTRPSNEIHYSFISFDKESDTPDGFFITNGNDLENRFLTHYRNSVNHKFPNDYAYEMYWEPLKEHYQGYNTLTLSPSGAYSQVNLLTFRNVESGKYLIDEKNIKLMTSLTHLDIPDRNQPSERNEVFIFGNPDYDLNNGKHSPQKDYRVFTSTQGESGMYYMRNKIKQQILWNELLYIDELKAHEVELLDDLYKSEGFITNLFTGNNAKEAQLKGLTDPYTLHISTHGYFMADDDISTGSYLDNQLLHSGLIFSGCFDYLDNSNTTSSGEDGLLTAYEIADLHLDKTEMVFLSSCETGLGIVKNGNSISNFQHAFQEAGAHSLIMTLWTTESEYELEFMNLFYFHWLFEKMPKREAFLKSVQTMKNSYENPYYWGAFVYIGE